MRGSSGFRSVAVRYGTTGQTIVRWDTGAAALRRFLFSTLYSLMAVAAGLLAIRFVVGPFRSILVTVQSPVNAAGIVAVAFVLLTLSGAAGVQPIRLAIVRSPKEPPAVALQMKDWTILAVVAAATAIAFWRNLGSPFVFDDYKLLGDASHATWRILVDTFKPEPGRHDLFFRPVGLIPYWLDYQWGGVAVRRWHLCSLAVHATNSCLLYLLVRRLPMGRIAALVAALLFALHGSRAETVAWTAAGFDLLAAFFVFGALLAVREHCRTGRRAFYLPIAACAVLAVYTKESAFCLPLLPATLLPFLQREERRRAIQASLVLASICALLFVYRWYAIAGIGGYIDSTGARAVLHSAPLKLSEALFYRQWAFLFFPVNWSAPQEWWLRASAVLFIAVLVVCAGRCAASRAHLLAGIAFVLAAALPVQHLLLLSLDFAGARMLYLPVAGLAIFWGALLERAAHSKLRWTMAAVLIAFNLAALQHNLGPWRTTPAAAAAVCRALGSELAADPRPVSVSDLPYKQQGVFFLLNGFPECVAMNSGQPASRVHVLPQTPESPPPGERLFVWKPERGSLEELGRALSPAKP